MIRFIRSFALLFAVATVAGAQRPVPPVPPAPPAPPAPPSPDAPLIRIPDLAPLARLRINGLDSDALVGLQDQMRAASLIDRDAMMASRDVLLASRDEMLASRDGLINGLTGDFFGRERIDGGPRYQDDPADSLYRQALDLLNRQDYRASAQRFKEVQQKYPTSQYIPRAMYYQALMLYRAGSDAELKEAIAVLEAQKKQFPNASAPGNGEGNGNGKGMSNGSGKGDTNRNGKGQSTTIYTVPPQRISGNGYTYVYNNNGRNPPDVDGLLTQIRKAQAARGDASAKQLLSQTASGNGPACDADDQAVRAEALSGLMHIDPAAATPNLERILAKRDECSTGLRRRALQILTQNGNDKSIATLIATAKSDPSLQIRVDAVDYIARFSNDDVFTTLESLARSESNERVRREAAVDLVGYSSPKARAVVRSLVEDNTVADGLRIEILGRYDNRRGTVEDGVWLRAAYPKVTSSNVKISIVEAVGRIGGPDNQKWLMEMSTNDQETAYIRGEAFRTVSRSMTVADLSHAYDNAGSGPMRNSIVDALDQRKEPEALDKLIEIVKKGTDPNVRMRVIHLLSNRRDPKDPKINALFAELIDR